MSINIMQGALAAAIMESRGADKDHVLSGALLSAFIPGVLGLAIPLLLTREQAQGGDTKPDCPGTPSAGGEAPGGPGTPRQDAPTKG